MSCAKDEKKFLNVYFLSSKAYIPSIHVNRNWFILCKNINTFQNAIWNKIILNIYSVFVQMGLRYFGYIISYSELQRRDISSIIKDNKTLANWWIRFLISGKWKITYFCPLHSLTSAINIGQPARLLCPWNSPGKNTGVGCHFLLQVRSWYWQTTVYESRAIKII